MNDFFDHMIKIARQNRAERRRARELIRRYRQVEAEERRDTETTSRLREQYRHALAELNRLEADATIGNRQQAANARRRVDELARDLKSAERLAKENEDARRGTLRQVQHIQRSAWRRTRNKESEKALKIKGRLEARQKRDAERKARDEERSAKKQQIAEEKRVRRAGGIPVSEQPFATSAKDKKKEETTALTVPPKAEPSKSESAPQSKMSVEKPKSKTQQLLVRAAKRIAKTDPDKAKAVGAFTGIATGVTIPTLVTNAIIKKYTGKPKNEWPTWLRLAAKAPGIAGGIIGGYAGHHYGGKLHEYATKKSASIFDYDELMVKVAVLKRLFGHKKPEETTIGSYPKESELTSRKEYEGIPETLSSSGIVYDPKNIGKEGQQKGDPGDIGTITIPEILKAKKKEEELGLKSIFDNPEVEGTSASPQLLENPLTPPQAIGGNKGSQIIAQGLKGIKKTEESGLLNPKAKTSEVPSESKPFDIGGFLGRVMENPLARAGIGALAGRFLGINPLLTGAVTGGLNLSPYAQALGQGGFEGLSKYIGEQGANPLLKYLKSGFGTE